MGTLAADPRALLEGRLLFDEFGDNSLNFEVHFWLWARAPMAMRRVQSRIRFRIDDLFREHGVVIAFPHRDVHLDSVSPLEERVVRAGTSSDEESRVGGGERRPSSPLAGDDS